MSIWTWELIWFAKHQVALSSSIHQYPLYIVQGPLESKLQMWSSVSTHPCRVGILARFLDILEQSTFTLPGRFQIVFQLQRSAFPGCFFTSAHFQVLLLWAQLLPQLKQGFIRLEVYLLVMYPCYQISSHLHMSDTFKKIFFSC